MSGKKIKKIPLLVWPGKLKTWWLFLLILLTFGANKATLSDFCYSWGPPRTPVRSLTSLATLPPSLISQPVQFSDFDEFWGLPISHASGSNGAPRSPPAGPQWQLGVPGAFREAARGGQNDPLRPKKHCFSI